MNKFAFIIHPVELDDIFRKIKFLQKWPKPVVEKLFSLLPPFKVSEITGIKTPYGETAGWFVCCPLSAEQIMTLPQDKVIKKIIKSARLASKLGADIIGLGALTSVVGDAGITVAKNLDKPITTGNSYTVATALMGVKKAAKMLDMDLTKANVAILGGSGSIGSVCARVLARDINFLTLIARDKKRLEKLSDTIIKETGLAVKVTSDIKKTICNADIVIAVSGAAEHLIEAEDLKPGSIVCDVARPRDVSKIVAEKRKDVLVIEGGVVDVPGEVDFGFNFGFPPRTAYACMSETMILALEGRLESYSLGRDLTVKQVDEMAALAEKHNFKLSGFRSFEKEVSKERIDSIKEIQKLQKKKLSLPILN